MSSVPDIKFIEAMEHAVGTRPALTGIDAVIDAIQRLSQFARCDGHTPVAVWPGQDALLVEVVSHFTRVSDGERISFPCMDAYRFREGRIADWRVFADMSPWYG